MASSRQAALQNLATGQAATGDDDRTVGGDETVSEALSKEVFSQYKASSQAIDRGIPHPGEAAVEATSLRQVHLALALRPNTAVWVGPQEVASAQSWLHHPAGTACSHIGRVGIRLACYLLGSLPEHSTHLSPL